jgi:spoIIIJ-associated protein
MTDTCIQANDFLNKIFDYSKLDLHSEIHDRDTECLFDIEGEDSSLLLAQGAELLDAFQHLLTQVFGHDLPEGKRFTCDAENYRATREAELRVMAKHAADKVRKTGLAFTFGPMNSLERRVIHMALSEEKDIFTESVGEGAGRRLKVVLKK